MICRDVQEPLIVACQKTGLDCNRADDSEIRTHRHITLWRRGLVEHRVALVRPRNATRAKWVKEMNMCIENRVVDRFRLGCRAAVDRQRSCTISSQFQ